MNEQNSTPSAKLISHVLLDFTSEAEMELFINYVEKTGANFYENMKKIGLMRFRLNQVWNKEGGLHYHHYLNIKMKMHISKVNKL